MRFSSFSLINSEYSGLDLTSSVPTCTLLSYFDKGLRIQSPPPASSDTPEPDSPCTANEGEEGVATEVESSDGATLCSATTSDGDVETFVVNARYPLAERSSRWMPDAQSIIVRREGSFIATCRIINPIPRGWIPRLPAFSLSRFSLKVIDLSRRAIEAPPNRPRQEQNEVVDTLFTLEKESEQDAKEITLSDFRRERASLGWTDVFTVTSSRRRRVTATGEFEEDERGVLAVPPVNVNVTCLVTKEVEVYTDDDLALLKGVSQN